jgi:hypothetical protein
MLLGTLLISQPDSTPTTITGKVIFWEDMLDFYFLKIKSFFSLSLLLLQPLTALAQPLL